MRIIKFPTARVFNISHSALTAFHLRESPGSTPVFGFAWTDTPIYSPLLLPSLHFYSILANSILDLGQPAGPVYYVSLRTFTLCQ
jgi:hypothetical protein